MKTAEEFLKDKFNLPPNCSCEEYKEVVFDEICQNLEINPKNDEELFKIINGFEIIHK